MIIRIKVPGEAETTADAVTRVAPRHRRNYLRLGHILIHQLALSLLAALIGYGGYRFSSHYLFQSVQVVGCSMAPTLTDSEHHLLNRWVYHVSEPQLADIVVLRDPVDNGYLVKRIVAQPGDRVYLKGGNIFVNGKKLSESYLPKGTVTFGDPHYREQLWICGWNQYFVLGDNRGNSLDSRVYGAIPRPLILGLVML